MASPIHRSLVQYSSQELLHAQAHVWNHTFNFINSMCLKCAVELGIPDIIHKHGKPMTFSDLIDALPFNKAKSDGVFRLMRILIHSKFFIKVKISENEENEGYWLTPASRLLLTDQPSSMAPFVLAMIDPILTDPFHHLGKWFQNDCLNAYTVAHGMPLWEHAGQEPRFNKFLNEAMTSDAQFVAGIIIKECKQVFEGLQSIVDVGGGTGSVARAIADAFPGLICVVLELPHVVAGLEGTHEKVTFVEGDMFESIPRADAVFLKWILHDWNDEECVRILEKCKDAIPNKENGGKVIILEMVVEYNQKECKATETQLLFDMEMMAMVSGKERTEKEWATLFVAAGFKSYKITPILGLRSLIEVFP